MKSNVLGRLRNTSVPVSQALLPVYEAVANSVHAIEDGVGVVNGQIRVELMRSPGIFDDRAPSAQNIERIVVKDNGVGFTPANWQSFNEADSQHKEERGGRGLGRFVWLKVFIKAEVESYFMEAGNTRRRSFTFRRSNEGIEGGEASPATGQPGTTVELIGLQDEYRRAMPTTADGVAGRLVEHFLPQLVLGKMPRLTVADPAVGVEVELHQAYGDLVNRTRTDTFDVAGSRFTLTHFVLTPGRKADHAIALTANDRRVEDWRNLHHDIPDLKGSLSKAIEYAGGDGGLDAHLLPYVGKDHVYYAGYLSGPFLNSHVDPSTRSSVRFPHGGAAAEDGRVVTEEALRAAAL
ncbi:MAG TPA: ATP-binding protein, partial [Rubricoccaceae bacterium]